MDEFQFYVKVALLDLLVGNTEMSSTGRYER